jgi:hypothetical protein
MFRRARIAKAQADTRALASSVSIYGAHMGFLPTALADLTAPAVNTLGQTAGPFIARVPTPPAGWSTPYAFSASVAAGTFNISASGDSTTVALP